MTGQEFYKLALARWGEEWRPRLREFLAEHGMSYSRQTFWNWQHDKFRIPQRVASLLNHTKSAD